MYTIATFKQWGRGGESTVMWTLPLSFYVQKTDQGMESAIKMQKRCRGSHLPRSGLSPISAQGKPRRVSH